MTLWRSLFLLSATMGFAAMPACGKRVTDQNLDQVKADMSKKEVESILGQPTSSETTELPLVTQRKTLPATRYFYKQENRTVVLYFVNDKFVKADGSFDEAAPTPTSAEEQVANEPDIE